MVQQRTVSLARKTAETDISLTLCLDGTGRANIDSGVPFLDHMLTLFCSHGRFDLTLTCKGDTAVDDHHSVEDIGIVLGEAIKKALGDKRGILRYGSALIPMDEALILASLDLSGRPRLAYKLKIPAEKVGSFDTELGKEFFIALATNAGMTLHLYELDGENSHHILEGAFKAFARALKEAVKIDPALGDAIPSSKGVLQ